MRHRPPSRITGSCRCGSSRRPAARARNPAPRAGRNGGAQSRTDHRVSRRGPGPCQSLRSPRAVPGPGLLLVLGILPLGQAGTEARSLGPTIGFLAAVLVLANLCDHHGLFQAAGSWMAAGSRGRPVSLLALVFAAASLVTAVLSLDATVVLLTPVVFATVARLRLRAKPHVYACTHLANSASLLLPVSNLTNLLAFGASGLSFARFGATMALPWLVGISVEWLVLRRFFAGDLVGRGTTREIRPLPVPAFAAT